jgi:hypothetical protein
LRGIIIPEGGATVDTALDAIEEGLTAVVEVAVTENVSVAGAGRFVTVHEVEALPTEHL